MKSEALPPVPRQARIPLPLVALMAALLLANACGGGTGNTSAMPGPTASFAFVANSSSGNVSAFAVSTTTHRPSDERDPSFSRLRSIRELNTDFRKSGQSQIGASQARTSSRIAGTPSDRKTLG